MGNPYKPLYDQLMASDGEGLVSERYRPLAVQYSFSSSCGCLLWAVYGVRNAGMSYGGMKTSMAYGDEVYDSLAVDEAEAASDAYYRGDNTDETCRNRLAYMQEWLRKKSLEAADGR